MSAGADPLHAIAGGAFQHHDSSWVFPLEIAGFTRVGVPQDIDGGSDAVAYYARGQKDARVTVAVTLHAAQSAKDAHRSEPESSQDTVLVGGQRLLRAVKSLAKDAGGAQTARYRVDTGDWIVRVQASVPRMDPGLVATLDEFVRQQQWASLGLSDQTCTGEACVQSPGQSQDPRN